MMTAIAQQTLCLSPQLSHALSVMEDAMDAQDKLIAFVLHVPLMQQEHYQRVIVKLDIIIIQPIKFVKNAMIYVNHVQVHQHATVA